MATTRQELLNAAIVRARRTLVERPEDVGAVAVALTTLIATAETFTHSPVDQAVPAPAPRPRT